MIVHPKPARGPLSIRNWAHRSGVVYRAFRERIKRVHWLTEAQRHQRAPPTEEAEAEQAAREARLRGIRETRAAEEERKAELVRLRDNILMRWYASDEYRTAQKLKKGKRKKPKHRTAGRKHGAIGRTH